ncbi:uncharacterized protein [Drosophila bipectinata]|uniref:uncharacterized protein n=1 Tax=Drosophila bipectinata TaxID=42026 RepID=UPI0038B37CA2
MVVDQLVKRSTVPRVEFKKVIVSSSSKLPVAECGARLNAVSKELGLKTDVLALQDDVCSIRGVQMTLESLQCQGDQCIITSDIRGQIVQPKHGVLANEMMEVQQPPRKLKNNQETSTTLGAAALAWTSLENAQRLQLQPLAVVREFSVEQEAELAIYRLHDREPIKPSEVYSWNLVTDDKMSLSETLLRDLYTNRLCTHDSKQITASHLLTHLVHSLPTGEIGCVFLGTPEGRSLGMTLEKIAPNIPQDDGRPLLTLYTRDPCPLCDELVDSLEQNFAGQYRLEKVYIDRKENVRYLRLFRHDIPVLFFNGQFLCMHRLNKEAMRESLKGLRRNY